MIFFQKTKKILEDELHYKLAQFEKVDERFEGVIRIHSKLGNSKPTQKKVQHFSISKYQYINVVKEGDIYED